MIDEALREPLDRLHLRGIPLDLARLLWWLGDADLVAQLEAASDDGIAEVARLWREGSSTQQGGT